MEKSQSITEIAKALVAFQGKVENVTRNEKNPFFKSEYATLDEIIETIRKPLSEAGLAFVQFPNGDGQLITLLVHTSGEYFQNTIKMTSKDDSPQAQGSVITYARRYSLSAILGIATEKDDDGNGASKPTAKPTTVKNVKSGEEDAYAKAVAAIDKAKTIGELTTVGERVDKSTNLTDTQKDALDSLIGKAISALEGNENMGHVNL